MAQIILIIGETGTGKSTSLENLKGEESALIKCWNKILPYKGWKKQFQEYNPETKTGNMFTVDPDFFVSSEQMSDAIVARLNAISKKKPEIKNIVIDDFQYLLSLEFLHRAKEQGWGKFNDIAQHAYKVIETAKNCREDLLIFFLWHQEDITTETNKMKSKVKTIGKLLDDKITIEGLYTIVLFTAVKRNSKGTTYHFITQSDGITTAKSPKGMFELEIPNDLNFVINTINEYYKE